MRRKKFLVIGLVLLMLSPVLVIGMPKKSMAANTVLWKEVFPPATSGKFVSEVCGDINADGHLDIIGGSLLGIWVAAGNGDGKWTPLGAVMDRGTWYGLALGDVNNDGKLDLVGAEEGSGVHVWAGDGAGGWTKMASPAVIGEFWSVALGDVNLDGNLDIAAGRGDDGGLRVWTGDGAGGWAPASTDLPGTGNYADVALGDVDRDGGLDLVAASHGGGVRAWRCGGGHSWTERSTGLPDNGNYYGVALGDLDNDGDLDIVATGDGVGVGAWTASAGTFWWNWSDASTGLPHSGQCWDVGLSDVNNDGRLDIAATSYGGGIGGGVRVWTGDGGGTWSEESTGLPNTGAYYGLTLGDWNDDGMPDLSAGQNAGVQAWVDNGTPDVLGGWLQIASPTTSGYYQGLDVGDWNRDGKLDIVAASDGDGIQLWEGDGGNDWDEISDWTSPDLPTSGDYYGIAFGDINHSGWLDVVAGSGDEAGIRAWLFMDEVAWIEHSGELPVSGTYLDVALGDFSNDGCLDIAAVGKELGVRAWRAEDFDVGSGWWRRCDAGMPDSGTFLSVAFGDLNDDGKLDIVAGSEGDGLGVWQGDGTGSWTKKTFPTTSGTWQGVAVGDVNDDGKLDLIAASDSGVRAWAGDGAFGWTALTAPSAGGKYTHVALGDLNNDGKLDIAAGTGENAGLEVWTGDGGTTWTPFSLNLPTTGEYLDVAFGEIDNDGILDLVGAKYGGGSVHAWTGAEGAPPSGWDNFTPTDWITTTKPVTCTIQVQDTGSGLDVNSAEYNFLGGAGWSGWKPARCSGTEGITTTQTIGATNVEFGQDSGPLPHDLNQVKFRVSDMVGNVGYSGDYVVYVDTTPPTNPITFTGSHWPGVWENDDTVDVDWDGAADETSGVWRYSYVFNSFCDLPDTVVDTAASMATSDPLADGEWYIAVRTRDTAGVWAPDAACDGPYRIETVPPTNPTGFDSSHDVGVWSTDDIIDINWWGAEDAGSGVFGYSFAWLIHSSTPDEIMDTTETHTTSEKLDEGDSWYFNIRTVDRADNWTPAVDTEHWGPFYIDTTDPSAWLVSPGHEVNTSSFIVTWTGGDAGSGIASFDVQTSDNGTDWDGWHMGTSDLSASFTGERGEIYYFRVRARDNAGNVSDWSTVLDVTVGVDVTVRVEDEDGTPLSGAKVYRNGREMGSTSGSGTLTLHHTLLDDELAAKYLIEEHSAHKGHHSGWAYRTYITSVDFDDDGNPQLHTVTNTWSTQVLTVRRDNPLVGFHILVSVEWDADSTFLNEVLNGFESASAYLFDLSDGQMLWEHIEIVDTGRNWGHSDYHIYASNTKWPQADVDGMRHGSDEHVYLGRYFDGSTSNQGPWDQSHAFRTTVHEFGHYGFGLYDEYLDSDGVKNGGCTTDRATTPESERACFMDSQYDSTEMCSSLPGHPHNTDTYQHEMHGEPCWHTVYYKYRDLAERWLLERPDQRGSIMPGPTSVPVADWMSYVLDNWHTGVCPPFVTSWDYPDGSPAAGFQVWVENGGTLQQGQTDSDGRITILGAHDGDTIRVQGGDCGWRCVYSGSTTVHCSAAAAQAESEATVASDPFAFDLSAVPRGTGEVLEIKAQASVALTTTPQVQVWQDGLTVPITVALTYDSATDSYTGTAILSTTLGLRGRLWGQATDTEGHTVTVLLPFNVERLSFDEHAWLRSDDGNLELFLKPNTLASDAAVSIMPSRGVSLTQGTLVLVSSPYEVSVSTGEYTLSLTATLNIYYHAEMVADVVTDTLQIYHWDPEAAQWISDGGIVGAEHNIVSTRINHLSTFAILGERAVGGVYLPLILKNYTP